MEVLFTDDQCDRTVMNAANDGSNTDAGTDPDTDTDGFPVFCGSMEKRQRSWLKSQVGTD